MPTLAVARDYLFSLLNKGAKIPKTWTQDEFEKLCFDFGVELDDVTSQREMFMREVAKDANAKAAAATAKDLSDEVIYKIDTPANRYDLLSAESMAIALRVFWEKMPAPRFTVRNAAAPLFRMTVESSVRSVRGYVVCAVLRNINFSSQAYNSFIDFQEKLHGGLARKRTLASVGTHDLDKIISGLKSKEYSSEAKIEFRYKCLPKEDISFVPLTKAGNPLKLMNCAGSGLEDYYKADRNISKFIPMISHLDSYPTILDSNGTILSLPPIINSDFSKIEPSTKNIFIECTATDHHKAGILVNQIVCAFSWLSEEPFAVDAVEVVYPEGTKGINAVEMSKEVTPDMSVREMTLDVATVNKRVGINIDSDECSKLLSKMYLYASKVNDTIVKVQIPPSRSDILHQCDLIEDVAIGFNYDNIIKTETPTKSYGYQSPINKITHLMRLEVSNAGYTEMMNFSLCSRDEAFSYLGREDTSIAVHIENPQTMEFQVCRPSLLPGTLKTFSHCKAHSLPIKLFEISDVVLLGDRKDGRYHKTGARNERHFAALHCTVESNGFENIHGLVEYVMLKLGVPKVRPGQTDAEALKKEMLKGDDARILSYRLEEGADGAFFPGRCMNIVLCEHSSETCDVTSESILGHLGVVHPKTLKSFEIPHPCSYCEINVEPFV